MNRKNLHKTLSQLRIITKYGIFGVCILMTLHCCHFYDPVYTYLAFSLFLLYLGLTLSQTFDLCWVHKATVTYTILVIIFSVLRVKGAFNGLGVGLYIGRGIMVLIGIILCILNIWRTINKNCLKSC